jgi:hypothetical protein
VPERVTQLIARRKVLLETTRELIGRLEKAQTAAELKQWAESFPAATRANRNSQTAIDQAAERAQAASKP